MERRVAAAGDASGIDTEIRFGAISRIPHIHLAVLPIHIEDRVSGEPLSGEQQIALLARAAPQEADVVLFGAGPLRVGGPELHLHTLKVIAQDDVDHAT